MKEVNTGLFVDVGANLGWYSLNIAFLGNYSVIAFEPVATNVNLFRKSICLNHFEDKIILLPYAVAAIHQICKITNNPGDLSNGKIACTENEITIAKNEGKNIFDISVVPLDSIIA